MGYNFFLCSLAKNIAFCNPRLWLLSPYSIRPLMDSVSHAATLLFGGHVFIDQCRLRENPSVYEGDGAAR